MSVACVSLMCVCVRLCRHWISMLTTQTTHYQEESKRMSVWCVSLMAVELFGRDEDDGTMKLQLRQEPKERPP